MAEHFGQVLRSIREAAGLSLAALAAKTNYHKSEIGYVETGKRKPHAALATACDHALGTFPLLTTVVETDQGTGDDMKRRALLSTITATVGVTGVGGATALADVVRHGLIASADVVEDWDAVAADYMRRLYTDPSLAFGESLVAQLMIARQQNIELGATPERLRGVALLSLIYGLWLGNRSDTTGARGWYRSATQLADRSNDPLTRTYVRGRTLSRGVWEGGARINETTAGVDQALAITKVPTFGALESLSALVHVHGYSGNLPAGRTVVKSMHHLADRLPANEAGRVAGPAERVAIHSNFLECRLGSRRDAEKAYAAVVPATSGIPLWRAEADIYYARALVRDGEVTDGVRLGLDTAREFGHDVRVIGVDVRDLLAAVPAGYRSDEANELATYASTGTVPWETIS